MYARSTTTSRSTTSQHPSYSRRPYEPDLLQSAVYSRTTQTNPSSGSYQQWKPAAARRRDSDIDSFVPSVNHTTTSSPSPTPGYGSDNANSSRSRTYFAPAIPPTLRRPSHSSRQSFDRDSDSQSTISTATRLAADSSERKALKGSLRQREVPVVKTVERSARSREREVPRDVPPEHNRLEALRSSPEETSSIKSNDETPTMTSTDLVVRSTPVEESPQAEFSMALVPAPIRRENSSSLSSIETPSDGDASRNTQETVATSVSSGSSPIAVTKVRRPSRDSPFDMLFGEDANVPQPSQSTVTDPQAPRKEPPTERSYPKSPPPAPLMMPCTLPMRNSIVEVPLEVPAEDAVPEPPLAIKAPKAKRKRVGSKPKVLAITDGTGSGNEPKKPSMADHPNWPKYLRLPQSPMSVTEKLNTPELEPANLPKDDDEVVYQPPLPAKPNPPRTTPPRARRRSNSGARNKRKNSADDTVTPNEPPTPVSPTSPRQRRQSSPTPLAIELPPPSITPQKTSPSISRKEASPTSLRSTTPLSTRRVSLKQEDISPSYFDLRSPSTDKLPLVEPPTIAPALSASTLPELLASMFPTVPPVPTLPEVAKEEPKSVEDLPEIPDVPERSTYSPKPRSIREVKIQPIRVPTPEPVKLRIPTPEPVKLRVPTPEPVRARIPTPEPVKARIPTPEPIRPRTRTPEPVRARVPTPEPVRARVPTPEPVKARVLTPEPVKARVPTPEPVRARVLTPEPVKARVLTPEPVKATQQQTEAPRAPSPVPSVAQVAHRPYLADYSRHFRTRSNSSISQITAATGQATPASEQAVPPPSLPVSIEPPKPTGPSRPASPARELKKKESKPAVSSRQKAESPPPAVQAPSRPLVPPIFPFGRKRGDSSASSKVPQGSLETITRERRISHVSVKSVDPPLPKPIVEEQMSPVEIKTPIYEIYKAKSTFAVVESPKEAPEPSPTEKPVITSTERDSPAEQPEVKKTLSPRQTTVPLISQAILSKVVVEADEPDDVSTIGHALDMFPNPPPVGQAIDTPPTAPVRQGRYPITAPDVMVSSRMDNPPSIRERHIRRPSLQVEPLPEIRSESPAEVKKPSLAPVQAPVATPPEPAVERSITPIAAPPVHLQPAPAPAAQPPMGASPSKESVQLPQRVAERKVAPSKPPTTVPPSTSLKRPSLERVPTNTTTQSTSVSSQPTTTSTSTRDRSASAPAKPNISSSLNQSSGPNAKTEVPPPLPTANPTPASGHSHSRSAGTVRDFDISSPMPLNRPLLPPTSEDTVRSARSRPRHEREISAPASSSAATDARSAARAHSSARHGHSSSTRDASAAHSRTRADADLPAKVPPLPSKVAEPAPAPAPAPPAPAPTPRHAEPGPPEAPPKPTRPPPVPAASATAALKESHRRHRVPLENPTASPAPPPVPKLPKERDPSPVPVTRHRSESPVGSGSSQVTDIIPGVPAKSSRRTGLLRGLFSRGDSSRAEAPKVSSRHPPAPPPPASHQSSSSERVDIPPVPTRPSASSRSRPPTTAPPTHHRRDPSPVPAATVQRHAEPTPAPAPAPVPRTSSRAPAPPAAAAASASRKPSAMKDTSNKGILSSVSGMFSRRQHYAVSAASLEAVLGASNNNPSSPAPSNINLDVAEGPDRTAAVLRWRTREAASGTQKIRRPGVTFADLGSEPGSPTVPARPRA